MTFKSQPGNNVEHPCCSPQDYGRKADEADFRSLTSPGLPCYVYSHALRGERLAALNAHLSINCPQLALQTRPWQSFGNRSRVSCPTLLAALGHSSNGQATDTSTVTRRGSDQDLSWYRVLGLEIATDAANARTWPQRQSTQANQPLFRPHIQVPWSRVR